jgi:LacI family transcriptional regulator
MSNIIDVALKARVSIATVSRVVNNTAHKVKDETRQKVLQAIRELDYRPNALAKGLLMKKTMTIGIIIPNLSNPYYAEIVRGIQDMADLAGYAVMLHNTQGKQDRIIRDIYLLREKAADGVIFSGGIINGYETLSILGELRDRVVVIGRHAVDFPAVLVDNMGGIVQAVHHLHGLGHGDIAFVGGPEGSTTAQDRLTGFNNAMARNRLVPVKKWIRSGDWTPKSGHLLAREMLQGRRRPTAIVAASDQMAFGVMNAARELGLAIPNDVAVVGFDNIPLSSYFDPPLTTVEIPMYDAGYEAMRMLIDLVSGRTFERLKLFQTKLLIRQSTVPS